MSDWADSSALVRKDKQVLTAEKELTDKKRKLRSGRAAGGTQKGKSLLRKLEKLGW